MTMIRLLQASVTLLVLALALGCDYNLQLTQPSTTTQATTTPTTSSDVVEFRVDGEVGSATVRVTNGLDGLTQTATVLPYTSQINLAGRNNVFLSLEARGNGTGFIHAAIYVNGVIFREGSASAFQPFVTINGTFRK